MQGKRVWLATALFLCLACPRVLAAVTGTAAAVEVHADQAPVREVITGLARLGDYNLVMGDDVQGRVSLNVRGVTPADALAMVATAADLAVTERGGTWIVNGGEVKADGAKAATVLPLRYAKAADIRESLTALLPEEHVRTNAAANSVIVYGNPREVALARELVEKLDYAYQQVKVEVEVVAVNRDHLKELGIDWDWLSLTGSADYSRERLSERVYRKDAAGNVMYDADGNPMMTTIESSGWKVDMPEGYGSIQFGRTVAGHPYSFFFQAKLNALVADGKAEILAKPNIMTTNGHEARILIGNKIPVLVEKISNGETSTTTEYRDAGIQLLYTPRINENGDITADVHAEVSSPYLVPEMRAYRIVTREANTTVRMRAGETLTIGGLIDREVMHTKRKVPILGDIPLLGKLFQSDKRSVSEAEIIIFIRAEIVK